MPASGSAFDSVAARYDVEATRVEISRWIRQRVWDRLVARFQPGDLVLEIGCGTGEDALFLAARGVRVLATDVSAAMLAQAEAKIQAAGLSHLITLQTLDLANAGTWTLPPLDGVFSNYGPLNCIGDWADLSHTLGRAVKPGGILGFAVMGRFCAWETLWHGLHLHWRPATRRWSGRTMANIGGVSFPVYYPTPGKLTRAFASDFTRAYLSGLGVFLPPSDVYGAVGKRTRLARLLLRLEKFTATWRLAPYIADHYWIEFRKR